jgi:hypothetical protein
MERVCRDSLWSEVRGPDVLEMEWRGRPNAAWPEPLDLVGVRGADEADCE